MMSSIPVVLVCPSALAENHPLLAKLVIVSDNYNHLPTAIPPLLP